MNAIPSSVSQEPLTACHEGEMRRVLRALWEASGLSMRMLDELAGLPLGYTEKCLCEPPLRNLGPTSFFPLLGALGHKLAFVADPDSRIRAHHFYGLKSKSQDRGGKLHWRRAKALGMITERARIWGSRGGKASFSRMTPAELKRHQRKAAKARWKAYRRRLRIGATQAAE